MKFIEENSRAIGVWLLCFVVGYVVGGISIALVSLGGIVGVSLIASGK